MNRYCGICHQETTNNDWCDRCLKSSVQSRREIRIRVFQKTKDRVRSEVAFRAWHQERKWMYDVRSINLQTATVRIVYDGVVENIPVKDVIMLPVTGLLDKHGNRIFDGDMVKCTFAAWEESEIDLVHVKDGCTYYGDRLAHEVFKNNEFVEVIGHAFEYNNINHRAVQGCRSQR